MLMWFLQSEHERCNLKRGRCFVGPRRPSQEIFTSVEVDPTICKSWTRRLNKNHE